MKRIGWFLLILFSIFFLPWYLTMIFGLAGFIFFTEYYEGIFLGFLYDALYFSAGGGQTIPVWFFCGVGLFFLIYFIRPRIRAYV